jgi:hypothetical protein
MKKLLLILPLILMACAKKDPFESVKNDVSRWNFGGGVQTLNDGKDNWSIRSGEKTILVGTSHCAENSCGKSFSYCRGEPTKKYGKNCWCKITKVNDSAVNGVWFMTLSYDAAWKCSENCALNCEYPLVHKLDARGPILKDI